MLILISVILMVLRSFDLLEFTGIDSIVGYRQLVIFASPLVNHVETTFGASPVLECAVYLRHLNFALSASLAVSLGLTKKFSCIAVHAYSIHVEYLTQDLQERQMIVYNVKYLKYVRCNPNTMGQGSPSLSLTQCNAV